MFGMPLLSISLGVQVATPLIALLSITIAVAILVGDWRRVQWAVAWRLVASARAGIPIGLYFLTSFPETIVKSVLAILIIAFSTYCLEGISKPSQYDD